MSLAYFVLVIRVASAGRRSIVVDRGIEGCAAARRAGRVILAAVEEVLAVVERTLREPPVQRPLDRPRHGQGDGSFAANDPAHMGRP